MNKTRILIIEDNPGEAANLQTILSEFDYDVVGLTDNIDTAYQLFNETFPELCIVDIYLKGKPDGITFARMLDNYSKKTAIIFLTGNYDNGTFSFAKTTNPHSYLLKPFNPLELQYTIELAIEKSKNPVMLSSSDTLFIKRANYIVRINIRDIKYIEVDGKYSKIISSTEKFLIQQSLKELQKQLPSNLFSRVHRNYLVNIEEVLRVDMVSHEVLLKDGTSLSFSRRYLDTLLDYFKVLK